MKLYKVILILLFSISLVHLYSQVAKSKGFSIIGHIEGIENGTKVYLFDIDAQLSLDSTISSNGNFSFRGYVKKPTACWIQCKNEAATIQVENTLMKFESNIKNMHVRFTATGGKEQSLQNNLKALQEPYENLYYSAYDSLIKAQFLNDEHKKNLLQPLQLIKIQRNWFTLTSGKSIQIHFLGLIFFIEIGKQLEEILFHQFLAT